MLAHRISPISAVGLLVIAGLALTGCTGSTPDEQESPASSSSAPAPSESEEAPESDGSEQTVAEACGVLQEGVQAIQTDLSENLSTFQSDPAAASTALNELAATFSANVAEVTNPEISGVATTAEGALTTLTEQFATFAEDANAADVEGLTQSATDVQTSFAALGEACA